MARRRTSVRRAATNLQTPAIEHGKTLSIG
jgi:hypothetical protein